MVTQEQIARRLGISRQLVSFALAGYPQVSRESRQRVLETAAAMNYRPNPHARALRRKRTGIIALWIPDLISTHYTHVARELNCLVKQARQELIITEVGTTRTEQALSNVPVDGIIVVDAPEKVEAYRRAPGARLLPMVSLGASFCKTTDSVQVNLRAGTLAVMNHLISSGFRRITHATFVREDGPRATRRLAYREALAKAGLKPEFIYYPLTERQRPIARQVIQEYVHDHGCPEAIFCHSDDAALGIYRGLRDMNLSVPKDVALAGCDGIEETEYLECPLTTLMQPVAAMCAAAWDLLNNRLDHPTAKSKRLVLQPELAIRQSTSRTARKLNPAAS